MCDVLIWDFHHNTLCLRCDLPNRLADCRLMLIAAHSVSELLLSTQHWYLSSSPPDVADSVTNHIKHSPVSIYLLCSQYNIAASDFTLAVRTGHLSLGYAWVYHSSWLSICQTPTWRLSSSFLLGLLSLNSWACWILAQPACTFHFQVSSLPVHQPLHWQGYLSVPPTWGPKLRYGVFGGSYHAQW